MSLYSQFVKAAPLAVTTKTSGAGTHVYNAATIRVVVFIQGGGGSGAAQAYTDDVHDHYGAGGGEAGEFVLLEKRVTGGASDPWAVGAGGAGPASNAAADGNPGSASYFSHVVARGGAGGKYDGTGGFSAFSADRSSGYTVKGGAGGGGGFWDYSETTLTAGYAGGAANDPRVNAATGSAARGSSTGTTPGGGGGGDSVMGAGGKGGDATGSLGGLGYPGTGYGSGGGGNGYGNYYTSNPAGSGKDGCIVIMEFAN